ncbi:MAG: hypothetical protein RL199_633 [Pseudomonadota bacterium]|jgi:hypothetical protein
MRAPTPVEERFIDEHGLERAVFLGEPYDAEGRVDPVWVTGAFVPGPMLPQLDVVHVLGEGRFANAAIKLSHARAVARLVLADIRKRMPLTRPQRLSN